MRRLRGFTLIEIAVVLFIGALLISGVVQYVTAQVTSAKLAATRAKQEAIKSALINFLARNNRLPCPADPTTQWQRQQRRRGGNTGHLVPHRDCHQWCGPPDVATGSVPWVSLGLTNEVSVDGYGNRFTFQVVLAATNLTAQAVAGMKGAIAIHSATPVAAGNQTINVRWPVPRPTIPVRRWWWWFRMVFNG